MTFPATVVNVMIASPSDVVHDRDVIRDCIEQWNATHAEERQLVLVPRSWESDATPSMSDRAQSVINKQVLAKCDLLVAVFWTRLGSPTGGAASGTVEEIEEHRKARKPAMLYFSNEPVKPDKIDEGQYRALRDFRDACQGSGLVWNYESSDSLRKLFPRHLAQTILREFPPPSMVAPTPSSLPSEHPASHLSDTARAILDEAIRDPNGIVGFMRQLASAAVRTNQKNLLPASDPRTVAKWKAAIDQLVEFGLLEPRGTSGGMFAVTLQGYELAEKIAEVP